MWYRLDMGCGGWLLTVFQTVAHLYSSCPISILSIHPISNIVAISTTQVVPISTSHVQSVYHIYWICPVQIPFFLPMSWKYRLSCPCLISTPYLLPMSSHNTISLAHVQSVLHMQSRCLIFTPHAQSVSHLYTTVQLLPRLYCTCPESNYLYYPYSVSTPVLPMHVQSIYNFSLWSVGT